MQPPRLTAILNLPPVYNLFQRAVGAHKVREISIEALAIEPGQRLLDIGCGPAYYVDSLPVCEYHGFDTDSRYIAHARRRFGQRARFYDEPYTAHQRTILAPFDRVMLMGLLHHLDDEACLALLHLVARSLAPGGRAVTLDTVLFAGQSRLSRLLAENDRGRFVRTPDGFVTIARQHFAVVEQRVLGDTWRIPSAHLLMALSYPL